MKGWTDKWEVYTAYTPWPREGAEKCLSYGRTAAEWRQLGFTVPADLIETGRMKGCDTFQVSLWRSGHSSDAESQAVAAQAPADWDPNTLEWQIEPWAPFG